MSTFMANKGNIVRKWYILDAAGKPLGKTAAAAATLLRGNTKRQEVKELIKSLDKQYPGLKSRVFGAMQGLPLPAWGPVEHRRVPLPEGD